MNINISKLLALCVEYNASDLHLSANSFPMLRVDGGLRKLDLGIITKECMEYLIANLLDDAQYQSFTTLQEIDLAYTDPLWGRFRVNCFYQRHGASCVFRYIPQEQRSLSDLNAPDVLVQLIRKEQGLIVVTGPTGSGKSTTLSAMIHELNHDAHQHILTIEDPIEYIHESRSCLIQQRQVGEHTQSFNQALKSALREDPDVILIGELRDLETIRLALTAAETGHLVLATLHTCSAIKTISRIIDVFPEGEQARVITQLSDNLNAVISQQLLKKKGGGRMACFEILVSTPAVSNLIRENRTDQLASMMQMGSAHGMITHEQFKQTLSPYLE